MYKDTLESVGVKISHYFGSKEYMKETRIPAGVALAQHMHPHDHISVLVSGEAMVCVDGISHTYKGYTPLVIEAGKVHEIIALTDIIWLCIHGTLDKDPKTVDTSILEG